MSGQLKRERRGSIVGINTYLIVHMICDEKNEREEHLEKKRWREGAKDDRRYCVYSVFH